jgi:hypothetical protein
MTTPSPPSSSATDLPASKAGLISGAPERKAILAASAPWLGALLNTIPGLGSGYIYQRRWKAYWITSAFATLWFVLGALLADGEVPAAGSREQWIGPAGLLLLAAITAIEAFLAARKARQD